MLWADLEELKERQHFTAHIGEEVKEILAWIRSRKVRKLLEHRMWIRICEWTWICEDWKAFNILGAGNCYNKSNINLIKVNKMMP